MRTREPIVGNQWGGGHPPVPLVFLIQICWGTCSQPLGVLGELGPESTLSKPPCQKAHRSWSGHPAKFHLLLVAAQALLPGVSA